MNTLGVAGRLGAGGAMFLAAVGCGSAVSSRAVAVPDPSSAREACWLAEAPALPRDSLVIAVHDRPLEGPGAARFDDGRRLVEALTVPPPGGLDCARLPLGALTVRWRVDSAGGTEDPASEGGSAAPPRARLVAVAPGEDPRDALDRGVDVLVTVDPNAVRYAQARPDLRVVALEPRGIYGVATSRARYPGRVAPASLDALRRSLAFGIVPAEGAPASALPPVDPACSAPIDVSTGERGVAPRIVHRDDDPVARAIAERLVSRAAAGDVGVRALLGEAESPSAAGLDRPAFQRALREGRDAAYVLAWPTGEHDGCTIFGSAAPDAAGLSATHDLTPLVAAAGWIIVRHGAVGIVRDADGAPRLVAATEAP
ncbi:MAG TPA: hypothetical protein VK922_12995 [Gemmatimonadaceae bacterium]|nr:hypothetical protein [Gemmatimonadaceae bacterium]